MGEEVILLDFWPSMFGMRARIALAEKGIKYEYREEDVFGNKSDLLLESNPIHKTIPVLIHNGKAICESTIILEYIDEVWDQEPRLLPTDPYERAHARFWVDYINKTVFKGGKKTWTTKGDEQKKAKDDFIGVLKVLEEELGDKLYFGSENFGFIDISLISHYPWFYTYETFAQFNIESEVPKLYAWIKRCLLKDTISQSLVDEKKVFERVTMITNIHNFFYT